MLLLDLNQTAIAALMLQINHNPKAPIEEDLVRHIILNNIRSYNRQFKDKYGKMVICCDSMSYWRKGFFQYYKSHRKSDREKSPFDWNMIFDTLNLVKKELSLYAPYKVIEVYGAEADDIIAVLSKEFATKKDRVLILSSDKDYGQLQQYEGVDQYSPNLKKMVRIPKPHDFLREHIIRGDRGDGIPNMLSEDDVFVSGGRQKNINTSKMSEWLKCSVNAFGADDTTRRGFARNRVLVDFDYIPQNLVNEILETYESCAYGTKMAFLKYMASKNLKNLMGQIEDF